MPTKLYPHPGLLMLAGLLLVTLVLWPSLSGGFIFDDYPIFAENPNIHVTGWDWAEWHRVWTWAEGNIHRPLAMFTYALNYALGGATFGFKLVNLGIHLLNTVLVWLLTGRLLRAAWPAAAPADAAAQDRRLNYWALGAAIAWAAHPLQVSAVAYVVQRMELMSFTFTLLALLAYWRARRLQCRGRRGWPWLAVCAATCVVGWGTKETIVLVPGYALLLELTVLGFAAQRPAVARAWKLLYGIGCVLALLVTVFYVFPHYATVSGYAKRDFTAWQRELTQLRALPMYWYWSVLPLPDHLVFYYDNYPASTGLLHPATTLWGGLFLAALLTVAVALRRRRPLMALGIGWFFVAHALTSAPIALELVFEHRNYPALLGVVLAVADGIRWLQQRTRSFAPAMAACVVVLAFGSLTMVRAATWGSPLLLATTLADYNPGSTRAALDLARRYMAMSGGDTGSPLYSMSIQELQRATTLSSNSPLPEEALLLEAARHPGLPVDTAQVWASLTHKIKDRALGPDSYMALHKLMTMRVTGATGIDAGKLAHAYAIAVQRNPRRLGLRAEYAELAAVALHDTDTAILQWQAALDHSRDVSGYAPRLAAYLVENHRYREARAVIAKAVELVPALRQDAVMQGLQARLRQAAPPTPRAP